MVLETATSSVDWELCRADQCQGALSGNGERCLAHLSAGELDAELSRFGRGRPFDARGVVFDDVLWQRVMASVAVDPLGRMRLSSARFDGATFEGPVDFGGALFTRDAAFAGARFRAPVSFRQTTIVGQARFSNAVFDGTADFGSATFQGPAWYAETAFRQHASWDGSRLDGPAWFSSTRFEGGASFAGTSFARHTSFDQAVFAGTAEFHGAEFLGDAAFDTAAFAHGPSFSGAVFNGPAGVPVSAPRSGVRWSGPPLARWRPRAAARLLDAALPCAALAAGALASVPLRGLQEGTLAGAAVVAGAVAAAVIVVRQVLDEGATGQSWGKRIVGLRVIGERQRRPIGAPRAAMRWALHLLDTLPLLAGWLRPLRDTKRQTFADKMAGTVVVTVGANWQRANSVNEGGCSSGCG